MEMITVTPGMRGSVEYSLTPLHAAHLLRQVAGAAHQSPDLQDVLRDCAALVERACSAAHDIALALPTLRDGSHAQREQAVQAIETLRASILGGLRSNEYRAGWRAV